ncbi:MAG: dethiobiotin synthetase [Alphaproteobacteria bacterium]|nr:dethiobiotin synthetase [Alphaproteobacteria bacterium]
MTGVFVTSTGTDIGKTFVTAGLIRHFRNAGRAVDAIKPIVTGFDPATAAASDPGLLLAALGRPILPDEIERISPWRFQAAASPDIAAQHEGRTLEFAAVVDFSRRAMASHKNILLIEGIGGIMVPLDARHTVLDWMTALRLPLILVAGSYLGTISHTLTALHVLARRNLSTAAVVVSETPGSPVSVDETIGTISRFADSIEVVGLPRLPPGVDTHPVFERTAKLL